MRSNPLVVHLLLHDPHLPGAALPANKRLDLSKEDDLNYIITIFQAHGYLHLQRASLNPKDPEQNITENANHPVRELKAAIQIDNLHLKQR